MSEYNDRVALSWEQIDEMRREWYDAVVRSEGWPNPTYSTQDEGPEPSEGTTVEPEQPEIPDILRESTPRRRRRPRGSYNRGLCIIRQRRARDACNYRCPCRTAYAAPTQQAVEPERMVGEREGGHEAGEQPTQGGELDAAAVLNLLRYAVHDQNVRPAELGVNDDYDEPTWAWRDIEYPNLDTNTDRG